MTGIVHIAGQHVHVGPLVRQRCGWCGALLEDHDLSRVAVEPGETATVPVWDTGVLLLVDGNVTVVVEHEDGADLPPNACAVLDLAVTA